MSINEYLSRFQRDLSAYFTIRSGRTGVWGGCRFIPHMDGAFNKNRHWPKDMGTEEKYLFAAAACMMVLLTQVVWKVKGEATACRLCVEMAWPICSAGLGGFLHPLQMMREAELLPEETAARKYRERYFAELDAVRLAMTESVTEFGDDDIKRELDAQMLHIRQYLQGANAGGDKPFRYPAEYPPRILET